MDETSSARTVERLFAGEFGAQYTDRNRSTDPRKPTFFHDLFRRHNVRRVLECGSNLGLNLTECTRDPDMEVWGLDIQRRAIREATAMQENGNFVVGSLFELPFRDNFFDLAFTCGVLIHVPPEGLANAVREMHRVSCKYLLCAEYHDEQEVAVPWRGHTNALFRRNYKNVFLDLFPHLEVVDEGYKSAEEGFDRITWQLFRKP
jgi:spore coat polysaccharide biosynthesis protein SpsF